MKKKLLIFSAIFVALLFLGVKVFGATTYERIPAGTEITNPISFNATIDDIMDLGTCEDAGYWGVETLKNTCCVDSISYYSYGVASTTLSQDFIMNLPVGDYSWVSLWCSDIQYPTEGGEIIDGKIVEGTGNDIIFSVSTIAETFIPISDDFVSSTIDYVGQAVSGMEPILWTFLGLFFAFWVIPQVISLIPKK